MRHPYLLSNQGWHFTQAEIQATPSEKALPFLPSMSRYSTQRNSRRLSISVPPPVDRHRHQLPRIDSVDCLSSTTNTRDTLLPGPPLVYITPPSTPTPSSSNTALQSEAVFNWAATASTSSRNMSDGAVGDEGSEKATELRVEWVDEQSMSGPLYLIGSAYLSTD